MFHPTRKQRVGVVLLSVAGAGGFVIARLPQVAEQMFGKAYFQGDAAGLSELRRFGYLAEPAKAAIDAYIAKNNACPKALDELPDLPAGYLQGCFESGFPHWIYLGERGAPNEYSLHMKLSWDGSLVFENQTGVWSYDNGDGSPPWEVLGEAPRNLVPPPASK
jgi:hypothetical protein